MNKQEREEWKKRLNERTEREVLRVRAPDGEKMKDYLKTISNFGNYSLQNVELIYAQDPRATMVAGYNQWRRDYGRYVKKGAKALHIVAPVKKKLTKKEKEELKTIQDYKIVGYRYIPVFDIRQTSGNDLEKTTFEGNSKNLTKLYKGMKSYIGQNTDWRVLEKDLPKNMASECDWVGKTININSKLPTSAKKLERLYHDYANVQLLNVGNNQESTVRELQSEAVAYVAMQKNGVEIDADKLGYASRWIRDNKTLHEMLEGIYTVANKAVDMSDKVKLEMETDKTMVKQEEKKNEEAKVKPLDVTDQVKKQTTVAKPYTLTTQSESIIDYNPKTQRVERTMLHTEPDKEELER